MTHTEILELERKIDDISDHMEELIYDRDRWKKAYYEMKKIALGFAEIAGVNEKTVKELRDTK